jgi:hypothetical protein
MPQPFPYLLLPSIWASRNRAHRRERGDLLRALLFGGIAALVAVAIFVAAFWIAWQLADYAELGDYLLRIGLSWLFLSFLSFLAFSGVVTALSTFFLSDDMRLLLAAPIAAHRLFHARFLRTLAHSSWMVIVFLAPLLLGIGLARCAPLSFYGVALLTIVPFSIIPVALGTAATLVLVNVFPARRARDILMLMGLLFAASIVILLRYIRPERLLRVESLPDITAFFATLQSPVTPLLPSFWAGETLFASLKGGRDLLHFGALWTTALMLVVVVGAAYERWHFAGFSNAQEARKAAVHPAARARSRGRASSALDGAAAPADQGFESVSAGRQPVVAAPSAARADAGVPLQLPGARSRAHPVHERHRKERLCIRESGDGGIRHGDRRGSLRLPGSVVRRRGVLDHPQCADLDA